MAKKDAAATATADEPNETYDALSQEGQDHWDLIGALGYQPEKGVGGLWFAKKQDGLPEDAVGPADSLQALHSMVKAITETADDEDDFELSNEDLEDDDVNDPEMIELTEDGEGNPYIPGAGPKVIKALAVAIREYDTVKLKRVELSAKEKTAKNDLKTTLKRYENYLEYDAEAKKKTYTVGKLRGVIKIEETETFHTDHVATEEV